MKIQFLILSALLSSFMGVQQPTASGTAPLLKTFTRVERIGEATARSFFVFTTAARNYTIRHDGRGESYSAKVLRRNFDLKTGPNARLNRVYFLEDEDRLYLLYEVTDGRSGWSFITKLDQATVKPLWVSSLNVVGIGPTLVEGNSVYLTGNNFVGKLDLLTGKLVWQHSQLEESGFVEFGLPEITPDHVLFREDKEDGRTIEVDKVTGKILGIRTTG